MPWRCEMILTFLTSSAAGHFCRSGRTIFRWNNYISCKLTVKTPEKIMQLEDDPGYLHEVVATGLHVELQHPAEDQRCCNNRRSQISCTPTSFGVHRLPGASTPGSTRCWTHPTTSLIGVFGNFSFWLYLFNFGV